MARDSSQELMPFLALAINQIAVSHLSKPKGESSNMVPTLRENLARGCFIALEQISRVVSQVYNYRFNGFTRSAIPAHTFAQIIETHL